MNIRYNPFAMICKKYRTFMWEKFRVQLIRSLFQRARYGFAQEDLFNLDTTLVTFIMESIKSFKEKTYGYPFYVYDKDGKVISSMSSEKDYLPPTSIPVPEYTDEEHEKNWHIMLDKVIDGMNAYNTLREYIIYDSTTPSGFRLLIPGTEEYENYKKKFEEAMDLLKHNLEGLWW